MTRRTLLFCLLAATVYGQTARGRLLALTAIPTPNSKITLSQYRGKVLVIAVISTTCGDCIQSVNMLSQVQKDLGPKGFQAFAAAGDENAQFLVAPFVQRYKPTFPVGYLTKDEIIKLAAIPKDKRPVAPIFLFIDKKGVVRYQYYGDEPFFKTMDSLTRSLVGHLLTE
jgi:thiol-disulfide isomerase/thioredoxin